MFTPDKILIYSNAFSASLAFEFFGSRRIAPFQFGHRVSVGAYVSKVGSSRIEGTYANTSHSLRTHISSPIVSQFKIGYEFNRRFPLKKGFYLKAAIAVNLLLKLESDEYYTPEYRWFYNYYVKAVQRKFLQKAAAFHIKIGIGKI